MFLKNSLFTSSEKSRIRSLTRGKLGLSTVVDSLKEIWPEDELQARDKLKKNSAQQGKQVLATIQVSEDYEDQHHYDEWPYEDWTSDAYYGEEGSYGEESDDNDGGEDEEEESDDVEGDNESELPDVGIEYHINNTMETRSFEIARKEKSVNKKNRNFYENHQCYHCLLYGHLSQDCPYPHKGERLG